MKILWKNFIIIVLSCALFSCSGVNEKSNFAPKKYPQESAPTNQRNSIQDQSEQNQSGQKNLQLKSGAALGQIENVETPKIIKQKIKIAALLPLSGKNKELGSTMLNSIILSLFENDKNSDVELLAFDSDKIKESIQKIIAQNIKTIIGPIFSGDIEAIAAATQQNNITVLSFSNNQDLSGKKGVFLMGFLPEQQIERISDYSISKGMENISIIAPKNQYGEKYSAILKDLVTRKDGNFVSSEFYANSNRDLEMAVSKTLKNYIVSPRAAKKDRKNLQEEEKIYANTIFIPESGSSLFKTISLINRYNSAGKDIKIIGISNWDENSTLNDPNLVGGWFTAPDPEKYHEFEKRYYQSFNKFPVRINSIAYDATLAVIETIKKSAKPEISTNDFVNYSSKLNGFVGIDGLFRFLPNGITQRNFAILEIRNGSFELIDSPSPMFFRY
jgi:branched-chain amino acid transport system substrate-binding protein